MKNLKGFTLIELMIVISIIGILSTIAIPEYQDYVRRSEVAEAISLVATARDRVTQYYNDRKEFPINNQDAGLPKPDKMIGNRVVSIEVVNGAIYVTLGNKIGNPLKGKVLTFRPAVVKGSPVSPISWLCGYDYAVDGMEAIGENKTDITNEYLPSVCRKRDRK
ncbi:pilin [Endozoicomonas sp. SM1973]|uniref:Pilin n=1 Tax=Spartinivicinus marinus TaxID=2994442 RepID=A0A853I723_9GAMM|nr:pilin [Spartinivicinus marinus]NYZ67482.1 pilin [Spartinivicinus marinus]